MILCWQDRYTKKDRQDLKAWCVSRGSGVLLFSAQQGKASGKNIRNPKTDKKQCKRRKRTISYGVVVGVVIS